MKFFKKAKKAFTLVELITVMAIIAVLAGVSVGAYFGIVENAKKSAVRQETDQIKTQLVAATSGDGYAVSAATIKEGSVTGFTAVMTTNDTVTITLAPDTLTDVTVNDVRYVLAYIVADNNGTLTKAGVQGVADKINVVVTTDYTVNATKKYVAAVKGFTCKKDGRDAHTTFITTAVNVATADFDPITIS